MRKKFIGPPNPGPDGKDAGHDVVVRGQHVGNVKNGDVIDVPDDLCQESKDDPAPAWSPDLWEDVKAPAKKKSEDD